MLHTDKRQSAHISIIGAGVAGTWQALLLSRAGFDVTLFERDDASLKNSTGYWAGGMLAPYCEAEATEPVVTWLGLRSLDLWDEAQARLRTFPNGATAMREFARSGGKRPVGCTQITEILITAGVVLIGPLPPGAELSTVYTAAVAAGVERAHEAQTFAALLTGVGSRDARIGAGFR